MTREDFVRYSAALSSGEWAALPDHAIKTMVGAVQEMERCEQALWRGGLNVTMDYIGKDAEIEFHEHYPKCDAIDSETGAMIYYHCHRPGEHGHFHVFVGGDGLPDDVAPIENQAIERRPNGAEKPYCHLAAIGMDAYGFPTHIFSVNRWVTDEAIYSADDTLRIAEGFRIEHAYPSWPSNLWLTAFFRAFKPQLETLLRKRDEVLLAWRDEKGPDVFQDETYEMVAQGDLDYKGHIQALRAEAQRRGLAPADI